MYCYYVNTGIQGCSVVFQKIISKEHNATFSSISIQSLNNPRNLENKNVYINKSLQSIAKGRDVI